MLLPYSSTQHPPFLELNPCTYLDKYYRLSVIMSSNLLEDQEEEKWLWVFKENLLNACVDKLKKVVEQKLKDRTLSFN